MVAPRRPVIVGGFALLVVVAAAVYGATRMGEVPPDQARQLLAAGSQLAIVVAEAHNSDGQVITTTPVGTNVHVRATVAGAFGIPTGTVTITAYSNGSCSSFIEKQSAATALGSNGAVDVTGFIYSQLDAGAMSFIVHYNGNATYAARDAACLKVTVTKVAPSNVTLKVHDPKHVYTLQVPLGTSVHAWIGVGGSKGVPTGSVRHSWWQNGNCFGDPTFAYGAHALVGGAIDIDTLTRPSTVLGSFSYRAEYLGNTTYTSLLGPCNEYIVVKATPTLGLSIHDAGHEPTTYLALGAAAHPAVSLGGPVGTPTGSVEISRYGGANCGGTPVVQTVGAAAAIDPAGSSFTRDSPGYASWRIRYLGDAKYAPRQGNCLAMRWKEQPDLTAVVHDVDHDPASVVVPGTAVHLRVTATGSGSAVTGNVAVYFYSSGGCPGNGGINLGNGALSSGVLDSVGIDTAPTTPGTYELVPTYYGDANYAPVIGPCVTFKVASQATPTPTVTPTVTPTATPTKAPTPAPTKAPTPAPTAAPTTAPTPAPTKKPTPAPSKKPTPAPTTAATAQATAVTTAVPGATASPAPSGAPSAGASPNAVASSTPAKTSGASAPPGEVPTAVASSVPGSPGGASPGPTGAPVPASDGGGGSSLLLFGLLLAVALVIGFGTWRARRGRTG